MTAAEQLRALVKEATPGPWRYEVHNGDERSKAVIRSSQSDKWPLVVVVRMLRDRVHESLGAIEADARLIALAPQLAELVADMGEELRTVEWWWHYDVGREECLACSALKQNGHKIDCPIAALLARLDALFSEEAVT